MFLFPSSRARSFLITSVIALGLMATMLAVPSTAQTNSQPDKAPTVAPGDWCGTQQIYELKYHQKHGKSPEACFQYGPCDEPPVRDSWQPDGSPDYVVRLMIHIIAEDDGSNPFSDTALIVDHMERINNDYASTGIQFIYEINHINETDWRFLDENEISAMKAATAVAPDSFLNVWPTDVNFSYSFGTFPWDSDALTAQGGIVMGEFHWLGGANSVFAHEVGHCLGLWHVFHGVSEVSECGACYEYVGAPASEADLLGDFCSDTRTTPLNRECEDPPGTDPCTDSAWVNTPWSNYMGYAGEFCLDTFTPQQSGRMRCWTAQLDGWLLPLAVRSENTFGPAPLEVDFLASTHKEVTSWDWDFGEGGTSTADSLAYTYTQPGYHTVSLDLTSGGDVYDTVFPGMVSAYADTMWIDSIEVSGPGEIAVQVSARNYLPLTRMTIPVTWQGDVDMDYLGYTVSGLRTENLDATTLNYSEFLKRVAVEITSGTNPALDPGTGAILTLRFMVNSIADGETNPIIFTTWGSFEAGFASYAGDYPAQLRDGAVLFDPGCCTGLSVGNVDGSPDQQVTIGDLSKLIDHLFLSLDPLDCIEEGDLDLSGQPEPQPGDVTVADLTVMVDHLFISLSPLPPCP
ncbi:PKD domain-containing protein [candidate division GN15 bacterium]|nr:PKD domain-containing protein [candidate division GN15 bacterium]